MTGLREKIGQLFMVGLRGESLTRAEQRACERYSFGGYILFARNCRSPGQVSSLCGSLWASAAGAPPFVAIDQEGGRVHRLPPPFTHFPAAALLGGLNDAALARRLGRAAANELTLAGINLNFAPVLDVNSNPRNSVIGDRSFGSTPGRVIEIGSAWLRGHRAGGVIPCGKHFPGHGDTATDSHFELPVVEKTLAALMAVDLPPFMHACGLGIEALMSAHVRFTALDPDRPATLSQPVVSGLLRERLRYGGVLFSDDMEMQAISGHYRDNDAALLAVSAGIDVLLYGHEMRRAIAVFEFLCAQCERDKALRERVESSYLRINGLKRAWLKRCTALEEGEVVDRLRRWDHRRLIEHIYGNL